MSKTSRHNNNNNNNNNNNDDIIDENDDVDECFYESLDRIASTSCSCSNSNSNSDNENDTVSSSASPNYNNHGSESDIHHQQSFRVPKFPMGLYSNYQIWISEPSSVSERRSRLLRQMGLLNDPSLSRATRSVSSDHLTSHPDPATIVRSKSDGSDRPYDFPSSSPLPQILSIHSSSSSSSSSSTSSFVHNSNGNNCNSNCTGSKKPPQSRRREIDVDVDDDEGLDCEREREKVCLIKNLDNGEEFVVNEIREDGMINKVKEVGTGKQLTMEEFQISLGHSPIVQELMRRQNVEDGNKNDLDNNANTNARAAAAKLKKKGSWFKGIRSMASSVTGYKERRSSDERDTGSEKGGGGGGGGRRSSSATDDSQDVSYHGPERVRVRQYGKSCKELSGLYKSQEIQAHDGSIWSIKFSLDGKYLASAGEDKFIHVWQVVESERKGDLLLMERQDDGNFNLLFVPNGSPEPNLLSPIMDSHLEKKRRGRTSVSRKSMTLDHVVVPETVFGLSEKPICSFKGHENDVLDLSWSKSQHLLSSSMDKTVRLWHLPSKSCLKVFSHSDYVTCIQFNPVDDRYFISGSLDAKVRIWSIPDRQVVDWNDVHEMVTAACYTSDGQGALVGSHKGSCHLYNTSENKLQQKNEINLQNKKKKSHHKKISGFQFAPGSSSEVLITSADSRIRVVDGVDLVHKFKGFRNTNSQISASLTANGKYVVSASEDSYVYVWKHEAESRPSRSKGVTVTRSYELFHCQDVSVAIPWPGMGDSCVSPDVCSLEQNGLDDNLDEASTVNHPPSPVEDMNNGSRTATGCTNSPLHGTISSATNSYFFDRISATWPEEKLLLATRNRSSPRVSMEAPIGVDKNMPAWGMVIVTAGRKGEIRTFQNFGLPVRI